MLLSSPTFAQSAISSPVIPEACGPNVEFAVKADRTQHSLALPEAGKALVCFIEEYKVGPGAIFTPTVRLALDGKWVGANRGGSYFSFSAAPGDHHLCASWQSRSAEISSQYSLMGFTAEAGKVYFFKIAPRPGAYEDQGDAWSKDLSPVNADEAKYLISTLPLSLSHPKK